MTALLRFLKEFEAGIYLILALFALIFLGQLFSAIRHKQKSSFSLEIEIAEKKIRSSITYLIIIVLLLIAQVFLISIASVRFPSLYEITTPMQSIISTPTNLFGMMVEMDETPEGFEMTQTAVALTGCIPGQIEWISPTSDDELSGSIELIGTINVANMGFYKYEYRLKGREEWIPIAAGNKPVLEENLGGNWNTEQLQPGLYELRIVVSDNQNNLFQPCLIEVKIVL